MLKLFLNSGRLHKTVLVLVAFLTVAFLLNGTGSKAQDVSGQWFEKTPMQTATFWSHAGVQGGKLYFVGGRSGVSDGVTGKVQVYDPNSDSWITKASMTDPAYGGGMGIIGDKIYLAGGWNWPISGVPQRSLKIYDISANSWSSGADMPILSGCSPAGVINGKLYVLTGCDGFSGYRQRLFEYDPTSDTWTEKAAAPNKHADGAGAVINGQFYVVGGMKDDGGTPSEQLDVYDPVTDIWQTLAPMPEVRNGPAATAIGGKLYVAGGFWAQNQEISTLSVFDPSTNTWSYGPNMPTARRLAVGAALNNMFFVAGGEQGGSALNNLEAFDVNAMVFEEADPCDFEDDHFDDDYDDHDDFGDDPCDEFGNDDDFYADCEEVGDCDEGPEHDYYGDDTGTESVDAPFELTPEMEEAEFELERAMNQMVSEVGRAEAEGYDISSINAIGEKMTQYAEQTAEPGDEASFWDAINTVYGFIEDVYNELESIYQSQDLQGFDTDQDFSDMQSALDEVNEGMSQLGAMLDWFESQGVNVDALSAPFAKIAELFAIAERLLDEANSAEFWTVIEKMEMVRDEELLPLFESVLSSSDLGQFFLEMGHELEAINEEVSHTDTPPAVYEDIVKLSDAIGIAFENSQFSEGMEMINELSVLINKFWDDLGKDHKLGFEPPAGFEQEVRTLSSRSPFPDIQRGSLEGLAAGYLYKEAVIGGFPDGEFKGERPVNRAEAAKFLLLAADINVQELLNRGRFWDVLEGEWYVKYVITAAQKGIIGGYPDGSFRPANTVNTAEFLKMLSLAFDADLNLSHSYSDVPADSWFAPYAGIAKEFNLFPDRKNALNPGQELTRREVAIAIYQYLIGR